MQNYANVLKIIQKYKKYQENTGKLLVKYHKSITNFVFFDELGMYSVFSTVSLEWCMECCWLLLKTTLVWMYSVFCIYSICQGTIYSGLQHILSHLTSVSNIILSWWPLYVFKKCHRVPIFAPLSVRCLQKDFCLFSEGIRTTICHLFCEAT